MIKNIFYSITWCSFLSCALLVGSSKGPITGNIILSSPLLSTFDGKSFAVGPEKIHAKLIMRTQILQMLYGVAKNGKRQGFYSFNGDLYTIEQLHKLTFNDPSEEKTLLEQVKADFEIRVQPFIEMGRSFKPQMLIFIGESLRLHKRNHPSNILLRWAETDGNNDMEAFYSYVNSFKDLSEFLYDLLNFLDDMISSCPKARQQFIDTLKTDKEKKVYEQQFQKLFEQQKTKINRLYEH